MALIMGGEQPLNQQPSCPTAPYRIDAYATALTGSAPPSPSSITFGQIILVRHTYGQPVAALEAGTYTIAVADRSKLRGINFVDKRTTRQFRGSSTETVSLSPGTYRYRILGEQPRTGSVVLESG